MGIRSWFTPRRVHALSLCLVVGVSLLLPAIGFADVEGSLNNMRSQLTHTILPILSVIGLGIASVSFFTGNPQAKQHIIYAILGCCFGFGAQAIADFIGSMVR
jgi:ABC-type dipeptide/oligopeptide/nickel transport system permease component